MLFSKSLSKSLNKYFYPELYNIRQFIYSMDKIFRNLNFSKRISVWIATAWQLIKGESFKQKITDKKSINLEKSTRKSKIKADDSLEKSKLQPPKKENNPIEKNIHFFWVGSVLPDMFSDNLASFIKNLPEGWKISVWTTNKKYILNSKHFKALDCLPKVVTVKNIYSLLENVELNKLFAKSIYIIRQELIGLGNPAAAKDGCTPLILYEEGGYFYDFDARAVKKIEPPEFANEGFLVLMGERGSCIPNGLAAQRKSIFCVKALENLAKKYQQVPEHRVKDEIKNSYHTYAPRKGFFSQTLRDRSNPLRTYYTINTSGEIINAAFFSYPYSSNFGYKMLAKFETERNSKNANNNTIKMGVSFFLKQTGNWRSQKKFQNFEAEDLPVLAKKF